MVENGPAGASEASVDIDSYKAAAILALLLVAIFAVGFPLIIDALRLRRDTSATAPPTGAIGAGDYARTLQQAAELVGGKHSRRKSVLCLAQSRSLSGRPAPSLPRVSEMKCPMG